MRWRGQQKLFSILIAAKYRFIFQINKNAFNTLLMQRIYSSDAIVVVFNRLPPQNFQFILCRFQSVDPAVPVFYFVRFKFGNGIDKHRNFISNGKDPLQGFRCEITISQHHTSMANQVP
ncbi:hypothetical protein ExPUPEC79_01300 [Escherichia coli]|nr:hypothetical protein ExPUPEC79_01300 [Escherichia coli]